MASPARSAEILQYLREFNYLWESDCVNGPEGKKNHINIKRKSGSFLTRKINSGHLKELEILLPEGDEKESIRKAFKLLSFPSGGGGGGRVALSRDEYTQQLIDMGLTSNKAGVLQLNVAKLWDFDQATYENNEGSIISQFVKRDFDFSIDRREKTITLKLK